MKYYIISGEASGDLHAANLLKELKKIDNNTICRCWGGEKLANEGGDLVKHYKDLAFMGFIEVVANLTTIIKNISFCKKDILHFQPDVIILVDYPGFNLRIAKWAKKNGFKDACSAASAVMSKKDNYSEEVVKMANYANNFGCKK